MSISSRSDRVVLVWSRGGKTQVARLGMAFNTGGVRCRHWMLRENSCEATAVDNLSEAKRVAKSTKRFKELLRSGWRVYAYRAELVAHEGRTWDHPHPEGPPLWVHPPEHPLIQLARVMD